MNSDKSPEISSIKYSTSSADFNVRFGRVNVCIFGLSSLQPSPELLKTSTEENQFYHSNWRWDAVLVLNDILIGG